MAVMVEEMVRGKRELRLWRGQKKVKSSSGHDENDKSRPCSTNEKEKSGDQKLVTGGSRQHLLDAIAKGGGNHEVTTYIGEDGKVRMKILVKKQDLKQILAAAEATVVNTVKTQVMSSNADNSVEKRLHDLMMSRKMRSFRRRKLNHNTHFGAWTPALHSIPEEHCAC